MKLFDLPRDELVLVLSNLSAFDVCSLLRTCRGFRDLFEDDELWHCLVSECFRHEVDVLRLVGPPRRANNSHPLPIPGTTSSSHRAPSPFAGESPSTSGSHGQGGRIRSFKDAYIVLKRLSGLRGLWRVIGEGDGSLVSFDWSGEHMVGQQLVFVEGTGRPDYTTFCSIRPSLDVLKNVQWEGTTWDQDTSMTVGIWTNDDRDGYSYTPDRSMTSQVSMDVADVGFGTPRSLSSRESPLMGASPENSFRQAWSQFMGSSVQARSKMRRRTSRNRFAQLRHLKRVEVPVASRRHPLAGIWVAEIDEDEFEVISVTYDFRSTAATLIGTKLAGAGFHEGGATIWKIRAAQRTDWEPKEIELYNRFKEYGNVEIQGDESSAAFELGLGLEALEIDDEPVETLPEVSGYHVGQSAYFSLFHEDRDDDGMWPVRLYVLNDDTLGLFFVDDNEAIIFFRGKVD